MLLVLPILIPLLVAAASLVAWQRLRVQRWLGVGGTFLLLAAAGVLFARVQQQGSQVLQVGGWPAPYGITLVADHLSALLVLVAGLLGAAVAVYSLVDLDRPRQAFAYYPLVHVLLMGVNGAFLTGDIFNLFVWIEITLISSFVLLALGSERSQLVGSLKYVTLNLVSSFLFLAAIGLLYGAVGTLNMADAARKLPELDSDVVTVLAMLFLVCFGVKAAIFPLYFWLPASYHVPPAAVSALFAGLLTKVGVYGLIRLFTLLFADNVAVADPLILVLAGFTMATGAVAAVAQTELRRMLSFLLISHIGFITLGLGLHTADALAGAIFYMVQDMIVIANLFLIAGLVHQLRGTYRLQELGGLYREKPWLTILFAIAAFSLAGIPPLSGFVGKLALLAATLQSAQYALAAVLLIATLLTLYCVGRMWESVFRKPRPAAPSREDQSAGEHPAGHLQRREEAVMATPIAVLAALTLVLGIAAQPVYHVTRDAAEQLLDPNAYIDSVLTGASNEGETPGPSVKIGVSELERLEGRAVR